MSNVVYLSTHPRFPVASVGSSKKFPVESLTGRITREEMLAMEKSDADELTLGNAQTLATAMESAALKQHYELLGQGKVLLALKQEAQSLMDEAFRARALGQESVGKLKEETAKYLLSLVASLPTKLRAQ